MNRLILLQMGNRNGRGHGRTPRNPISGDRFEWPLVKRAINTALREDGKVCREVCKITKTSSTTVSFHHRRALKQAKKLKSKDLDRWSIHEDMPRKRSPAPAALLTHHAPSRHLLLTLTHLHSPTTREVSQPQHLRTQTPSRFSLPTTLVATIPFSGLRTNMTGVGLPINGQPLSMLYTSSSANQLVVGVLGFAAIGDDLQILPSLESLRSFAGLSLVMCPSNISGWSSQIHCLAQSLLARRDCERSCAERHMPVSRQSQGSGCGRSRSRIPWEGPYKDPLY